MSDALQLRVQKMWDETAHIRAYELVSSDAQPLPSFKAGSFVRITTPAGYVRKYSLCNAESDAGHYLIAVKREAQSRGGSASMWNDVRVGTVLSACAPEQAFALVEDSKPALFIAGGIGITPILSMLQSLEQRPIAPRSWKLIYLTRDAPSTAFAAHVKAILPPSALHIHHTQGASAQRLDLWPLLEKENQAHVYCCGSTSLMNDVRDMSGHWNPKFIHFENFDDAPPVQANDQPFEVRCASNGAVLPVPVGQSILQVLNAHGFALPYSCESGTCGTCKTQVLEGTPDHRDFVLLPEEQTHHIMVCVSRAHSPCLHLNV